jgi:hypothetical protein
VIFKFCLEVRVFKDRTQKIANKKKLGKYGCLPEDGVASASRTDEQTPGEGATNLVRTQKTDPKKESRK